MNALPVVLVRRGEATRWHLARHNGETYCGVVATNPVPDGARGNVCPTCRKLFTSAAGIVNMVNDSRKEQQPS